MKHFKKALFGVRQKIISIRLLSTKVVYIILHRNWHLFGVHVDLAKEKLLSILKLKHVNLHKNGIYHTARSRDLRAAHVRADFLPTKSID